MSNFLSIFLFSKIQPFFRLTPRTPPTSKWKILIINACPAQRSLINSFPNHHNLLSRLHPHQIHPDPKNSPDTRGTQSVHLDPLRNLGLVNAFPPPIFSPLRFENQFSKSEGRGLTLTSQSTTRKEGRKEETNPERTLRVTKPPPRRDSSNPIGSRSIRSYEHE